MHFVDEASITIRSGKGGNGVVSFRREKFEPKGGPDGGNGGDGGSVYFRAVSSLMTLYDFRMQRVFTAENGQPGSGGEKNGRSGKDLIVDVPVGTLIYELQNETDKVFIADLNNPGEAVLVLNGGRGGKGNTHFKSSVLRTPRFAQPGEEGLEKRILLELRLIADVGLIGMPNAGKSTFLSAISAARPKIAPYPFTTIVPRLGVIKGSYEKQLVIADLPGLIQGAHAGVGLGDRFLRHAMRTRLLVHLLSIEDITSDNFWEGFELTNQEINNFNSGLSQKEQIFVLNKIDLVQPEKLQAIKEKCRHADKRVFFISALHGQGIQELLQEIWQRLS